MKASLCIAINGSTNIMAIIVRFLDSANAIVMLLSYNLKVGMGRTRVGRERNAPTVGS